MPNQIEALRNVPLFHGMDEASLRTIASFCSIREYGPGKLVIGETDTSVDVLILLDGTARISLYSPDGQRVGFRDIGPGTVFGEISAIDGLPRSASVEASGTCKIAIMSRAHFLALMQSSGDFALAVSRQLTQHVRRLTTRIFEFSTMAVRQRLRAEILRLGEEHRSGDNTALISPMPTHADLASRISTHREAVSRETAWLDAEGFTVKQGRNVLIPSLSRLRKLLDESWDG